MIIHFFTAKNKGFCPNLKLEHALRDILASSIVSQIPISQYDDSNIGV